jgi:hypothetical protein
MSDDARSRVLEVCGLLFVLAALGVFLAIGHKLQPWSDPGIWFHFARHFAERVGEARLAYGFPLVAALAIRVVGVVPAFLINVPILVGVALLVYALGRSLVPPGLPRAALVAPFGGAVSLLLLIALNQDLLGHLANPFRDPLSHLLLLLGCWLVLDFRRAGARSSARVAAAAALLAFACAARETAVLVLLPLLAFAITARLGDRSLPFARPLLVFGAVFALANLPLLAQNLAVSGHALVPAQASLGFAESRAVVPGVRADRLAETLPAVLAFLGAHFGPVTLALGLAGLLAAVRHRQAAVLSLFLPGALTYALFYGGYDRVVPRYLFAVDLFALPISGVGAAALLTLALHPLAHPRRQRGLAAIALATALLAAAAVPLRLTLLAENRFGLAQARELRRDLALLLPPEARVIGEFPFGQILGCFAEQEAFEVRLFGRNGRLARNLRQRVRALAGVPHRVYAVSHTPRFQGFLESEFDLVPVPLEVQRYGLKRFSVHQLIPWSGVNSETRVEAPGPGDYLLALDVGALSKEARSWSRVLWQGASLDEHPVDGRNYYRVTASGDPVTLALISDRPVPAALRAALLPLDQPLRLDFDGPHLLELAGRVSDSFLSDPYAPFPKLTSQGSIDVPTVGAEGAFFVFAAEIGIENRAAADHTKLSIEAGGEPLFAATLVPPETEAPGKGRYEHEIVFWAGPARIASRDTRLLWKLGGADPLPVSVRSLTVYRYAAGERLEIDLGAPWDAAFVAAGFRARESLEPWEGLRWRRAGARALLRIFAWPGERPLRLTVHHLEEERRPGARAPDPRSRFNGHRLRAATTRRAPAGPWERVTTRFDVPAAWVQEGVNLLEIRSGAGTRAEPGDADPGPPGLRVDGVLVEPGPLPEAGSGAEAPRARGSPPSSRAPR